MNSIQAAHTSRSGFTMLEVFAVVLLIGVMVGLLLPAVQSAREMTRRSNCGHHLVQLGLAVQTYHHAFDQFPVQLSGTEGSKQPGVDNDRRLSFLVALLPYLGEQPRAEIIRRPLPTTAEALQSGSGMIGYGMMESEVMELAEEYAAEQPGDPPALPPFVMTDEDGDPFFVAGGPEPWVEQYEPWGRPVAMLLCPSDAGDEYYRSTSTNYAACLGDAVLASHTGPMKENASGEFVIDPQGQKSTEACMRGAFVPRMVTRLRDITDGRAHTVLLGEIICSDSWRNESVRFEPIVAKNPKTLRDDPAWARGQVDPATPEGWAPGVTGNALPPGSRRGVRWTDGMPLYTAFHTILPPNDPIALATANDASWGVLPPSSHHDGGAQIAMADGSVRFITDSIDCGDVHQPTVYPGSPNPPGSQSPYGVWGAMGTRASEELTPVSPFAPRT